MIFLTVIEKKWNIHTCLIIYSLTTTKCLTFHKKNMNLPKTRLGLWFFFNDGKPYTIPINTLRGNSNIYLTKPNPRYLPPLFRFCKNNEGGFFNGCKAKYGKSPNKTFFFRWLCERSFLLQIPNENYVNKIKIVLRLYKNMWFVLDL